MATSKGLQALSGLGPAQGPGGLREALQSCWGLQLPACRAGGSARSTAAHGQ